MIKALTVILLFLLLIPFFIKAQKSSEYEPDKPGTWTLNKSSFTLGDPFDQNAKSLAEWFQQHAPILTNPKGFDLLLYLYGIWDDKYKLQPCNYAKRGELTINFELFISQAHGGGKWTVEPPHWSFYINNTESGHGANPNFPGWDNTKDPESLEAAMDKAAANMNDVFRIFPFVRDIAPGVKLYGDGNLIVYNPDRPPFWIPVTVREVANMKLAYHKLKDAELLPYLKEEIAKLTEADLNAMAYSGNEELFLLNVHPELDDKDRENGGQIMRFNPDYWDRTLPKSAIQFLTFGYNEFSQKDKEVHFKNNGYPIYGNLIMHSIKLEDLHGLITKKK